MRSHESVFRLLLSSVFLLAPNRLATLVYLIHEPFGLVNPEDVVWLLLVCQSTEMFLQNKATACHAFVGRQSRRTQETGAALELELTIYKPQHETALLDSMAKELARLPSLFLLLRLLTDHLSFEHRCAIVRWTSSQTCSRDQRCFEACCCPSSQLSWSWRWVGRSTGLCPSLQQLHR